MKQQHTFVSKMVGFWDSYAEKAEDYPSLDIWFKDGSYLKFFIQPRIHLSMPLVGCTVAYADDERSVETPTFVPALHSISLGDYLSKVIGFMGEKGVELEKEVERIYENVI